MLQYKSNQPLYKLHFSELEENAVKVFSFEGEENISRLFEYRFELVSEDPELDAKSILNKKATFTLTRGEDDPLKIHGIISHFEQRGRTPDYVSYYAVLVPKLWRLGLIFQNEVYQKMDVAKLIAKVMENSGFTGEDYEINFSASYPEHEYIVQYQETNLNFLHRRLEHYGVFYCFEQREDREVIVFTDSNMNLPVIASEEAVALNPNKDPLSEKETLHELSCEEKVVTGLIRLKDYNYLYPDKQLQVESQINGDLPGMYYAFGDHFEDEKQGELLARVRNEEFLAESKIFKGRGDCRLFHAGFKFTLEKHYRKDWNADYLLTRMRARGTQRGLFGILQRPKEVAPTYENTFEAIPVTINYRPPRRTPVPRMPGIMSAKVESSVGDEYAFIDDHGRYRAKMLFDVTDRPNGEATLPIRQVQAYSGTGYGMHFPNHADTELVWACVDGNVDRPIGLGTVPNPAQASPVVMQNKSHNLIRTAAGNEILLDDRSREAQILLNTPDANNMLFDDKDDKIEILTTQKHRVTFDDKNKNITVKTTDGHVLVMDDKNTKITVQSKNGHRISINDTANSENITLVDKDEANMFVIDITNKKLVILTKDGHIDMHAPNGTIDLKAATLNVMTSGDTIFKTGANFKTTIDGDYALNVGGNSTAEASGDLAQKATNVTVEAGMDHVTKGMNVTSEAQMEHKIKGLNVTAEASVSNQIKGALLTSESAGPHTIKGAPVMIN